MQWASRGKYPIAPIFYGSPILFPLHCQGGYMIQQEWIQHATSDARQAHPWPESFKNYYNCLKRFLIFDLKKLDLKIYYIINRQLENKVLIFFFLIGHFQTFRSRIPSEINGGSDPLPCVSAAESHG